MRSPSFHLSRVAFASLLLSGAAAFGQLPPATPPAPAAPPASAPLAGKPPVDGPAARPRPPGRPAADAQPQAQTTTLTGRVARWLPNPNGEVDGLLLDDGTQVAFAPHLSARVLGAVKLGDSVLVSGRTRSAQNPRVIRATEIRSSASGQTVSDEPRAGGAPPAPRDHAALTAMKASGRIATLLHSGRGDVNGVVLADGTVVRFPPHAAGQLAALLKTDGTLYAQGYGTSNGQGSAFEATRIGATAESAQAVFPPAPRSNGGPDGNGPAGPGKRPQAGGSEGPRPPADGGAAAPAVPPPQPRPAAPQPASAPR